MARVWAVVGVGVLLAGAAAAQERYLDPVFGELTEIRNVEYGSAPGADGRAMSLRLDLYAPAADPIDSRPALIWIHGGGFVSGSKTNAQFVELARRFARRGYVSASIDYRLATSARFAADPASAMRNAMHDARAAVRYLRANAALLGVDPERIAIGGGSAGAYTALLVAYEEDEGSSGSPGYSSEVSAVVDLWGALPDLEAMEPGEAPLLIVHGSEDRTVPYARGVALVARAEQVGVPYEFHPLVGAGHAPWQSIDDIDRWSATFLYRHAITGLTSPERER